MTAEGGMVVTELLYTVKEASKVLKVNPNKVYELINAGHISALKLGSIKVRVSELERFVNEFDGKDLTDLNNVKPFL